MASGQEWAKKFLTDESFRADLLRDPKGTMRAHGIEIPEGIDVEVIEWDPEKRYIVLPPLQSEELSEEQLMAVQGGTFITPTMFDCPTFICD